MRLPPLAETLRRADPDRFLTTLFAPVPHRPALWALYVLNHELARARDVAASPELALIRLQWWREALQRGERGHEVLTALGALLAAGRITLDDLDPLIEGRMREIEEGVPDIAAFFTLADLTAGALAAATARLLGADASGREAARCLGQAYGIAGLLRAVPYHARQGRVLLPRALLADHGLAPEEVLGGPGSEAVRGVVRALARQEQEALAAAPLPPRFPPALRAVALLGILARRDLARLARRGESRRQFGDRLAVIAAGLGLRRA